MKKRHPPTHQIEMRIAELSQLFDSMDPTPFHHRDLDTNAERFIESWALEFSQNSHFRIIVHIQEMSQDNPAALVAEAIHNHFEYKSVLSKRKLRLLLLEGQISLLIGLGFLGLCLLGADLLSGFANNTFLKILKESLLIGGWVAMWRPMQIFLYEWWPIVRRGRIYRNLSSAIVHVVPVKV
ncbi:MAG: hypothetical protein Q7R66_15355 [Undibacterium sp.]|uniref:hypothetical protein n=1 Tax=Undibacterium sp. TaxID=1914977 RepID=UPI002718C634|nr:hypothetical protein [Undibacterium sp.]MDO8653559.1 hypothetical protein [Undibacterium sp.]